MKKKKDKYFSTFDTGCDALRDLTNNFTAPQDAEPSIHFLYFKLKEFDADLETHHELEDKLLFTKASVLESELEIN